MKSFYSDLCLAFFILFFSCNKREFVSLEVGEYDQRGIIVYVVQSGQHGLIVSAKDVLLSPQKWICLTSINLSLPTATAIGLGKANTENAASKLSTLCGTSVYQASVCFDLILNGYSDWYLPGRDELNQLYLNKEIVNESTMSNTGNLILNGTYWSSSTTDDENAWAQSLNSGEQIIQNMENRFLIRAVRSFQKGNPLPKTNKSIIYSNA